MNCPNCRHENADEARFCAQCGTPLTQPAPIPTTVQTSKTPAAQPARHRNSLIVLLVFVLLLALGGYAALHVVASKTGTPTPAAAQNTARPNDSTANAALTQQRAQPDTSSGNTKDAPDAAGAGQAPNAMRGLLGALSSAVGGAHRHDPVGFHTLETLLPSTLPGMQAAAPDGHADDTMSIKTTSAHVDFTSPSDSRIKLSITDATAISGLAGLADMANPDSSQQGDSYEKTETIDGRSVHETWDATARHGQLSLSVGQRFAVDVVGDNVDMDALKNALAHIDLAKLESMKDANPVKEPAADTKGRF